MGPIHPAQNRNQTPPEALQGTCISAGTVSRFSLLNRVISHVSRWKNSRCRRLSLSSNDLRPIVFPTYIATVGLTSSPQTSDDTMVAWPGFFASLWRSGRLERAGRSVRFGLGWFVSVSLASQLGCRCRLRRVGASGLRLRFAEELAAARERSGVALNNATRRPDAGRPVAHAPRVCSEHSPDDSSSKNSFNDQVIQASPAIRSRSVRGRRCGGPSSRSDTARV